MRKSLLFANLLAFTLLGSANLCLFAAEDNCAIKLWGEFKLWHKITLDLRGPFAREKDNDPNPFLDYRMTVRFVHESGKPVYEVPGYFACDGNAAETSADKGNIWRAQFRPDKTGKWYFTISFEKGKNVAVSEKKGKPLRPYDGKKGSFVVKDTDKRGRDLRAEGRLQYVGEHYLRFAGSGRYFLKAGADAPETLLAYKDFDGTETRKVPLKTWAPHVRDWRPGDPTWKNGKGKGLIGAINYLSGTACNAFSFITYNVGGDGDNVWPHVAWGDKLHFDCSKLDQWQIVFDHAQRKGMFLHFKLQEQENDDNRLRGRYVRVPAALDGGALGIERKLYLRELVARFGYELALNWNLGEENSQSTEEQRAMASYIREIDPYDHPIVVHTFPNAQDRVYTPLLGKGSVLDGVSLQNSWKRAHQRTLKWVKASRRAGKKWVVANDEQNPASYGVPPDLGYMGFKGRNKKGKRTYTASDIRKYTLWGTIMAGGAGVEYYFGYNFPQNDLLCEDWRSRAQSWKWCAIMLRFFRKNNIPFWAMENHDELVGNPKHENTRWCFAAIGKVYLVYLPKGGTTELDLRHTTGKFQLQWYNPREGGALKEGSVKEIPGGKIQSIGFPPEERNEDWVCLVKRIR